MLTEEQIKEIQEHLENSQNPLFFFDNDVDGLASFLLLARAYKKGKGVAIKGYDLNSTYLRKVTELTPDYVFVLDKPVVSSEFIEEVKKLNIPLVWIDHHDVCPENIDGIYYYNPAKDQNGNEPTTYLAYQITRKQEDLWIAVAGCVADNFLPDFIEEFKKKYPELLTEKIKIGFDVLYNSEIGKIARILNFCLKDRTSNVLKMLRFLLKVSSPNDISEDNSVFFRFQQINKKYQKLIDKAKEFVEGKILFFQYGGDLSLSADISNELSYNFPDKLVVVAYLSGVKANVSLRGKNARKITLEAIEGLEQATGGGHEEATGAKINVSDLPVFKKRIEEFVS